MLRSTPGEKPLSLDAIRWKIAGVFEKRPWDLKYVFNAAFAPLALLRHLYSLCRTVRATGGSASAPGWDRSAD